MIKTVESVSYNPVDLNLKAIVFARVTRAVRNDENETYTLHITEWVELPYTQDVPNEEGEMEPQEFINKKEVRSTSRVMTFAEADQLTGALDQMFPITETGTAKRKRYTVLGHLVINNQEAVRNVAWELAE